VIAGVGMVIAFFTTMLFLPALLFLFKPPGESEPVGLKLGAAADGLLRRFCAPVLAGFFVLALVGVGAAVTIGFDANPLDTKDPHAEAMRTLSKLLADPATNPFYADALAPSLAGAAALGQKLSALPQVAGVISGATFVPADQAQKLAMLGQAQTILAPALAPQTAVAPVTADAIRAAMAAAHGQIVKVAGRLPAGSPVLAIDAAMVRLSGESDARIMAMNAAVTRFLPAELNQLNGSLSATAITQANLPKTVARNWFLPDGRVRVEAFPSAASQTTAGLRAFAAAVLSVAPGAGGPAISTMATARTILYSFREAAVLATLAITVILVLVFRNVLDSALVLVTLALSALLTALLARLWGLQINYANIIALPLLLGVGVSFNVYFVMNARAGMKSFLSSATARAVLFSALTTGTAFGTLAASHDRGTASMGILLLLSLMAVLMATFVFLPALLYRLGHAGKTQR